MKKPSTPWVVLAMAAALAAGVAGCEDSARQPVAYHPPPPPSSASTTAEVPPPPRVAAESLPLEPPAQSVPSLSAAPPDGIDRLAARVQAIYDQGQRDYQAGDLADAQTQFDLARKLLVESGFELQSDSRLSALDAQIVEASAQLNATPAPQDAEASAEAAPTAASPLDEISDLAAPPDASLAAPPDSGLLSNAEGELRQIPHDLPLTVNDAVLSYLNFFQTARGRAIVETGLRRAGRYRVMIQDVLRQEGLPSDLMYIAQAESAFQPQALSRAGARGLWQFMSYRGRQYGLQHTTWVDDRQDPEKATHAAAQHLRDLYGMFGDWYLVMAAYNSGPGTVQHAVERTGYADFWDLYRLNVLPQETKNYVPIILALTLIAKDPARYGIDVQPDDPIQTDDVMPGHPLNLRLVAESLDLDVETLQSLNPQLLHLVTPADPSFVLHLPAGASERFFDVMTAIPSDKWLSWREHRVAEGETLASIARTYRVRPADIVEVNGIEEDGGAAAAGRVPLEVGAKLVIPVPEQAQVALGQRLRYRSRHGDTLESVADQFDVTVAELKKWNHLRGSQLPVGIRLTIYPGGGLPSAPASERSQRAAAGEVSRPAARTPVPVLTAGGQKVVHRVRPGETLYSIAQAYMTTVEALRAGNRFLFSRPLQAGDALTIWLPR